MPTLLNKVAVVTGASQGIGRSIAIELASCGANVVLTGRNEAALYETRKLLFDFHQNAIVVPTDVRDAGSVAAMSDVVRDEFGRVDIVCANSGIAGPTAPIWEINPDEWSETLRVNLDGVFLTCRSLVPLMVPNGSGSIVVTGSMTGKRPLAGRTPYSASKMALVGLVRTLAVDLGGLGIRANLVSPGPVTGDRLERVLKDSAAAGGLDPDSARNLMKADSPLGRLTEPEDVARTVAFLASDEARGITGQDVNVSSGLVMY